MSLKIHIEGGGDDRATQLRLRVAFAQFIANALPANNDRPSVSPGGGRNQTAAQFVRDRRLLPGVQHFLVVDSEGPPPADTWAGLGQGAQPADALCFLMVQTMEAWLVADADALSAFYGQGFRAASLPQRPNLEEEPKVDLYAKLAAATAGAKRGPYAKAHGWELIGKVDPAKVRARCPAAARFLDAVIAALPARPRP